MVFETKNCNTLRNAYEIKQYDIQILNHHRIYELNKEM